MVEDLHGYRVGDGCELPRALQGDDLIDEVDVEAGSVEARGLSRGDEVGDRLVDDRVSADRAIEVFSLPGAPVTMYRSASSAPSWGGII
jgi:hypothetical protein